ncbi:MAG: hypothetical protein IT318_21835 [Anaerolineales bacterium]|nr:hypothetical protein [Anaerolineales bacterium]
MPHRIQSSREKGVSSAEFALVMPAFFLAVMVVLALALWLFSLLLAATGVPAGARVAGTEAGLGSGYARVQTIMGVVQPAASAAGAAQFSQGAPGCERAIFARLNGAGGFRVPLLGNLSARLQAGAQGRDWRFWAGKPSDGCD